MEEKRRYTGLNITLNATTIVKRSKRGISSQAYMFGIDRPYFFLYSSDGIPLPFVVGKIEKPIDNKLLIG